MGKGSDGYATTSYQLNKRVDLWSNMVQHCPNLVLWKTKCIAFHGDAEWVLKHQV